MGGLLEQVLGQVLAGSGGGPGQARGPQGTSLVESILVMLGGQQGGIDGMSRQFQQAGLGEVIASWISTGQNRQVSPDDLTRALGREQVTEFSQRAGLPQQGGASILAQLLPVLIDQLTPKGQVPQPTQLPALGADLLRTLSAGSTIRPSQEDRIMGGSGPKKPDFSNVTGGSSSTAPPPKPAAAPAVQTYTVVKGDNLSKIAKHFYGNANQWKHIFEANRDQLEDPDKIFPGQVLKIPAKS